MIVVTVIFIFTLVNVLVSAYMSYLTIDIAIKRCRCAVYNAYWVLISLYFTASVVFLIYSMLVFFNVLKGARMIFFVIGYLVSTFIFVGGSYAYTKYLSSSKCDCVSTEYKNILQLITYVRLLMSVITFIALLLWGAYVLYVRKYLR